MSFEVSGGFGVVFSDEVLCSCLGGCLCRLFVPGRFLFGRFCAGQLSAEFCSSCFPFLNSYCPVIGCLFFFSVFAVQGCGDFGAFFLFGCALGHFRSGWLFDWVFRRFLGRVF